MSEDLRKADPGDRRSSSCGGSTEVGRGFCTGVAETEVEAESPTAIGDRRHRLAVATEAGEVASHKDYLLAENQAVPVFSVLAFRPRISNNGR